MKQISRESLKEMMDKKAKFLLIDARMHEAYEREHLPGAVTIPSEHLHADMLSGLRKTDTLVTYCSSSECDASKDAAKKLEKFGFKKVLRFKGGIKDWKDAGYPTEK